MTQASPDHRVAWVPMGPEARRAVPERPDLRVRKDPAETSDSRVSRDGLDGPGHPEIPDKLEPRVYAVSLDNPDLLGQWDRVDGRDHQEQLGHRVL